MYVYLSVQSSYIMYALKNEKTRLRECNQEDKTNKQYTKATVDITLKKMTLKRKCAVCSIEDNCKGSEKQRVSTRERGTQYNRKKEGKRERC